MSGRPWWGTALQWGLWFLLMTLVMGWLSRNRLRKREASDSRVLVHPFSTLIVGGLGFGLFATLTLASILGSKDKWPWWTTVGFLGFTVLSVPMLLDYFRARHEISESGLAYRTLLTGARKQLQWSNLRKVRYADTMKWFRLETTSGDVARISAMMMGLPEFARLLLQGAPPQAIDKKTREILVLTAEGQPPSLWV